MKIDQNRMSGQDLQSKSAQKSEKAGKPKDEKERVGGESRAFKQIFEKASEKGVVGKTGERAAGGEPGKAGVLDDKKATAGVIDEALAKRESASELERDGANESRLKDQGGESDFDVDKQRLSEIGEELKKVEIDEQAVLSGAVPEVANGSGIQQAEQAAPAAGTDRAEMAQLANKIVQAFYVGQDARAKKVVMMDVNVPGRGSVRVRLSKTGDSVDVRMRADNEDLARLLRAHREDLRESGASKGVNFANIEVVG